MQSQLDTQRSAIFSNLQTSYTASKAREGLLQSQMDGANKQMAVLAQYDALKKEADANTQLYAVLYQKIKEVAIAAETKSSSIRIIDRARVLNRPTKPKRVQNELVGCGGRADGRPRSGIPAGNSWIPESARRKISRSAWERNRFRSCP